MTEIRLDRSRAVTVIRQLVAKGAPRHVGVSLIPRSAAMAGRSTMREKPGADSGAPRSETSTNGN